VSTETVAASDIPTLVNPTSAPTHRAVSETPPQVLFPASLPSATPTITKLQQLGIHTSDTLDLLCVQESRKPFVVEGLMAAGSIGIVVGDSGLGKSPLIYQLALSVAAELPWLGMRTRRGTVLYLDHENGSVGSKSLRDSVMRHLRLEKCPENFLCTQDITDIKSLTQAVETVKPDLVVIDTLRSFDSTAEENNTKGGTFLQSLRKLCQKHRVSFLLIHHIKKQDKKGFLDVRANLEADSPIQWLNLACGARTLVNQSDVRLGVDRTSKGNASLILRGHVRITGEVGPFYLERVFDDDEQPIGYQRRFGVEFLDNKEQQAAFDGLPPAFSFKEAKTKYGRRDQATIDFLNKCLRVGILRKPSKGLYEKVARGEGE
jgi:AAA domain